MLYRLSRVVAGLFCLSALAIYSGQACGSRDVDRNGDSYAADLQVSLGSQSRRAHLVMSHGRFRLEDYVGASNRLRGYIELYDGNQPPTVWGYNSEARSARPLPLSCLSAVARAMQRNGGAAVRNRYHLPATVAFAESAPRPTLCLPTLAELELASARPSVREPVAGKMCDVRERAVSLPNGGQTKTRAWAERQTGLVMKCEETTYSPPNSPVPPMTRRFVVTKITFGPQPALGQFELPPGTAAHVPETFRSVKLPARVKRVDEPGVGIEFPKNTRADLRAPEPRSR